MSALQAVGKASHCWRPRPAPQIHRRVTERKGQSLSGGRRGQQGSREGKGADSGSGYTQHWSHGGWEELKNPIT